MAAKNWDQLVENAPTIPFNGNLERQVAQLSFDKSHKYLFTSGNRNRCNPKGVFCIYMAEDRETARAEYDKYYTDLGNLEPSVRYTGRLRAQAIVDLGDPKTRDHFNLSEAAFFTPFRTKKRSTPLEQLGKAISKQSKISGIRFPSDAMHQVGGEGFNIVVFRDSIKKPNSLKIFGPAGGSLEDWPESSK